MNKHIPLIFNDHSKYAPIDPEHLCLHYTIKPNGASQPRVRDQLVALPKVDLSEYEFRATYDWIEIFVETNNRHQARNLQPYLKKLNRTCRAFSVCSVLSPARKKYFTGRGFVIRVQNPQPEGLRLLLRAFLRERCQPSMSPSKVQVTGLELSIDIAPRRTLHFESQNYIVRRMLMKELLVKHCFVNEAFLEGNRLPRFHFRRAGRKHTPKIISKPRGTVAAKLAVEAAELGIPSEILGARLPKLHKQPFLDATWYFGDRAEQLHFRCMDKTDDHRNGDIAVPLPLDETRARIEVSMLDVEPLDEQGPYSVDIRNVEDIAARGMAGFNLLFCFCLPTFQKSVGDHAAPQEDEWEIFSKSGITGLYQKQEADDLVTPTKVRRKAKARRVLMSTGRNMRYSEFNARVAKAILRLDKRWARDWEKGAEEK